MCKLFPKKQIDTNTKETTQSERLLSMEELYGSLKPYVNGYLSDADIDDAISKGAFDSGMTGKK